MAYRALDNEAVEAPTAAGPLRIDLGPRAIDIAVGARRIHITADGANVIEDGPKPRTVVELASGAVFVARGRPRESLGVWFERAPVGVIRVFGVEPEGLLDADGLAGLACLGAATRRLRLAIGDLRGRMPEASFELGVGHPLDKVLVADRGDHHEIYCRGLFRDHARPVARIYPDGRVALPDGSVVRLRSAYDVTVRGDYVRFADNTGADVARISVPWIALEDREQLARLIGQLATQSV